MKSKVIILILIFSLFIVGGCLPISRFSKDNIGIDNEFTGPGGCIKEDCKRFCEENVEGCKKWCLENTANPMCTFILTRETLSEQPIVSQEINKIITANPIDLSQIARISKFRSCAGHDYSGLNIYGEKETLRSMKHYIEFFPKFLGYRDTVKVFAPFDGKIVEIIEAGGKQVFISADAAPMWHFIFFHISLESGIEENTNVKAGQVVGYAYVSEWPTFDIALKKFNMGREIFESPFLHMQDYILDEYASYGITSENIIFSKQYRDANSCPLKGELDMGEERFTGETEKEDFVILK